MGLLKEATIESSKTYTIIEPWGQKAINALSFIIPFFKDMFTDLQNFFGRVAEHQV
jgi:membrane protein required for colicin V production